MIDLLLEIPEERVVISKLCTSVWFVSYKGSIRRSIYTSAFLSLLWVRRSFLEVYPILLGREISAIPPTTIWLFSLINDAVSELYVYYGNTLWVSRAKVSTFSCREVSIMIYPSFDVLSMVDWVIFLPLLWRIYQLGRIKSILRRDYRLFWSF